MPILVRWLVSVFFLAIACNAALAQSDKISLQGITASRAEAGERVRVIVNYTIPEQDFPEGSVSGASRRAMIASSRLNLLQSAFGSDFEPYQPKATPHIFDRPTVVRPLETVPSMAMMLTLPEMKTLASDPRVTGIYTDKLMKPMLNDSTVLVGAPPVWASGSDGADYAVAVLDTGASFNHPMIASGVIATACVSSTDILQGIETLCPDGTDEQLGGDAGTNCPVDDPATVGITEDIADCWHGTHVASTAMGAPVTSSTGVTIQGVARGANLFAIQVFSKVTDPASCGAKPVPCISTYNSDYNRALDLVLSSASAFKIVAVNMSLGAPGMPFVAPCDTGVQTATKSLIDQLRAAGVATVIAAGNDKSTIGIASPACISTAIAVGATTKQDAVASFSNSSPLVDLLAPGVDILAAYPVVNGFYYDKVAQGTSQATPHVAGAFALLKSANPGASVQDIEDALKATGVPIIDTRNLVIKPRIRVDRANDLLNNGGGAGIGNLAIAPADGFYRFGKIGNSGSFGTQTYTLTNNTGASVTWSVAADKPFIVFNKTGGTLAAGASDTVIVSVDAANIAGGGFGAEGGIITFTVGADTAMRTAAAAAVIPANDDFADAEVLTGLTPSSVGTNFYALKETGEPNHIDGTFGGTSNAGGASVWYQWTAPEATSVDLSTSGSDFDTVLGVYTGASVSTLAAIANNDDEDFPNNILTSRLTFNAVAGTTYFIAVDGFVNASGVLQVGNVALSLTATPFSTNTPPTGDVIISGNAIQGQTLMADTSTIDDADGLGPFSFQWRRSGVDIAGATASTYTLTQADVGSTIDVVVTYTDGGGTDERLVSAPTGTVQGVSQFTLMVSVSGPGTGTVTSVPAGIDCGTDCDEIYAQGTMVTLIPSAGADSILDNWGGDCTGGGACIVTMDQARTVNARFKLILPGATTLFSAVLPSARSGSVNTAAETPGVSRPAALGDPITVFASVINAGPSLAQSCQIIVPPNSPVTLSYQLTDAANVPTGPADAIFDLAAGQLRSFILSFTPTSTSTGKDVFPDFSCDNANVAAIPGVNTVFLSIDDHEVPDVLSIAATPSGDGIITVPSGSSGFMTVSAANIGVGDASGSADAAMKVSVDTGAAALPLLVQLCETDATSVCITPLGTNPVDTVIGGGASFFAVFVSDQSNGNGIALDPANARIFLRFKDAAGTVRSVTSAAITVPAAADAPQSVAFISPLKAK